MLSAEENDLLCRVEHDAPMGRLMRRHWVPALLSEEVAEADGRPVRVRLFGENLVAFRDSEGRVGLLEELCPHRRASLVYGRNEACGLRCLYHGWKIDVDGRIVEMNSEPAHSALAAGHADRARHRAYPTREAGGFVWAYLGPPDTRPPFRAPAFAPEPATPVSIVKMRIPCNWAQITEGQIDSAHSSSLHASDMRPAPVPGAAADEQTWYRPSTDRSPRLQTERTGYGFHYAAIRRPIRRAATHDYVRVTEYLAPFVSLIPPNDRYNVASVIVPAGDTETLFHFVAWGGQACPDRASWRRFCRAEPGVDLDADWRPTRTLANDFGQDRAAMRGDSVTGIDGIPNQDLAMWVGMGPIVDRSRELLGASDVAIVEFRRLMVEAAQRMQCGGPVLGIDGEPPAPATLAAFEGMLAKAQDWRQPGTASRAAGARVEGI